jgi:hypothetical protein
LERFAHAKTSTYDKKKKKEKEFALNAKKVNKYRKLKQRLAQIGRLQANLPIPDEVGTARRLVLLPPLRSMNFGRSILQLAEVPRKATHAKLIHAERDRRAHTLRAAQQKEASGPGRPCHEQGAGQVLLCSLAAACSRMYPGSLLSSLWCRRAGPAPEEDLSGSDDEDMVGEASGDEEEPAPRQAGGAGSSGRHYAEAMRPHAGNGSSQAADAGRPSTPAAPGPAASAPGRAPQQQGHQGGRGAAAPRAAGEAAASGRQVSDEGAGIQRQKGKGATQKAHRQKPVSQLQRIAAKVQEQKVMYLFITRKLITLKSVAVR